jgi:hypothetical protein
MVYQAVLHNAIMLVRRVSSFSLLLQLPVVAFAASQCYYPNGKESTDQPCNPDADVSPCCGTGLGSVCLSNLLCQGSNGNVVRGSCTDKNWGEGCALYCLGESECAHHDVVARKWKLTIAVQQARQLAAQI